MSAEPTTLPFHGESCHKCELPGEVWCLRCHKLGTDHWVLCSQHNSEFHATKHTSNHPRIDYQKYKDLHRVITEQSTQESFKKDQDENTLLKVDFLSGNLETGNKLEELTLPGALDSSKFLASVAFIGTTGSGKSFLIRCLLAGKQDLPQTGDRTTSCSNSSDLHGYVCDDFLENCSTVFLDSEGIGGSGVSSQSGCLPFKEQLAPQIIDIRKRFIKSVIPQASYMFSDVICCTVQGSIGQTTPLDVTAVMNLVADDKLKRDGCLPKLCIIFNQCSDGDFGWFSSTDDESQTYSGDFSMVYNATSKWSKTHKHSLNYLKKYFSDVYVFCIPIFENQPVVFVEQLRVFKKFLQNISRKQRKEKVSNTHCEPEFFVGLYKFALNSHTEQKLLAERAEQKLLAERAKQNTVPPATLSDENVTNPPVQVSRIFVPTQFVVNNLVDHWRYMVSMRDASEVYPQFKALVGQVYSLRKSRLKLIKVPGTWDCKFLTISKKILNYVQCSAEREFTCATKGTFTVKCEIPSDRHNHGHQNHKRYILNNGWNEGKFSDVPTNHLCNWEGEFESPLNHTDDRFIGSAMNACYKQHETNPENHFRHFHPSSYCLICFAGDPTVTITCGHNVCQECYSEIIEPTKTCNFCCDFPVDRVLRQIPEFSGPRVLALDGGGTRGIIQSCIISNIRYKLDVPISDLFDFVIGCGTGGISSLALVPYKKGNINNCNIDCTGLLKNVAKAAFSPAEYTEPRQMSLLERVGSIFSPASILPEPVMVPPSQKLRRVLSRYVTVDPRVMNINEKTPPHHSGALCVAVTAFEHSPNVPQFISNNFIPNVDLISTKSYDIIDAALRASASPPYLPSYSGCIDGSFAASCPSEEAMNICARMWPGKPADFVLSVGTSRCNNRNPETRNNLVLKDSDIDVPTACNELYLKTLKKIGGRNHQKSFSRIDPVLEKDFAFNTSDDSSMNEMIYEANRWITHHQREMDVIYCKIICSCIILEITQPDWKDRQTITADIILRPHLRGRISDSAWEITSDSVLINNDPLYEKTMTLFQNPKRYSVTFERNPLEKTTISISANTAYGTFGISGCSSSGITLF